MHQELGHGENATYEKLLADPVSDLSDVLVSRLAMLIHTMARRQISKGTAGLVVLSSSWRRPRHRKRLQKLEEALSAKLDMPFKFLAATNPTVDDNTPGIRLELIGDFVAEYGRKVSWSRNLQVLVLDDFHTEPLGNWVCGGHMVATIQEAEAYLESRVPSTCHATARIVHTYEEFTTAEGTRVQVGSGLTCEHFCRANTFLGGSCMFCTIRMPKILDTTEELPLDETETTACSRSSRSESSDASHLADVQPLVDGIERIDLHTNVNTDDPVHLSKLELDPGSASGATLQDGTVLSF